MLKSVILIISATLAGVSAQTGNTTCKTNSLDWYTSSVGETPCRTYERLRQSCDNRYRVGNFPFSIPPDRCDSQLTACCCNSIGWALSMLCLNCQWGYGSGIGDDTGLDALNPGGYQAYLGTCGSGTNQSLPNATQTAVCNQNINIPNYVYTLFWNTGQWYYEFTRQTAQLQIQSGQNGSHCASPPTSSMMSATNVATPTSSSLPATTPAPDDSSSTNIGAIIGGVIGGVGLLLIAALVFYFSRRRRSNKIADLSDDERPQSQLMTFEPYVDPPNTVLSEGQTPSVAPASSTGYSHPNTFSDTRFAPYVPPARTGKVGMTESGAPNRDETGPLMSDIGSSMSERHEDSAELTQAFALSRSNSGRLPPSYQER